MFPTVQRRLPLSVEFSWFFACFPKTKTSMRRLVEDANGSSHAPAMNLYIRAYTGQNSRTATTPSCLCELKMLTSCSGHEQPTPPLWFWRGLNLFYCPQQETQEQTLVHSVYTMSCRLGGHAKTARIRITSSMVFKFSRQHTSRIPHCVACRCYGGLWRCSDGLGSQACARCIN